MPNEVIEIMWGDQSFPGSAAKVNVLALTLDDGTSTVKRFPSKVLKRHGSGAKELASQDGDIRHGQWFRNSLQAQDGIVLLFTCSTWVNKRPMYDAGLIVRLREEGAFSQVKFRLTHESNSVFNTVPIFNGRGDILTPDALMELGYHIPRGQVDTFFDEDELEEALEIQTMGAERAAPPVLATVVQPDGSTDIIEVPAEPRRRLRRRVI